MRKKEMWARQRRRSSLVQLEHPHWENTAVMHLDVQYSLPLGIQDHFNHTMHICKLGLGRRKLGGWDT